MDIVWLLVGLGCGAAIGALISGLVSRSRAMVLAERERQASARVQELQSVEEKLKSEHLRLQDEAVDLQKRVAELETRLGEQQQHADDKIALLSQTEERLREQFKALAGEALNVNAKRFGEQQQERLEHVLNPLRDRIQRFEQQVAEARKAEHGERERLRGELHKLFDLNQQMSTDAVNLTKALRGQSKTRGDWGEMMLATLLERSGLEEGREFTTQHSYTSEEGQRLRPDVVIHLPENRCLIIDSKVQLESWAQFSEAEDETGQAIAAKALVVAMRGHVKDLANKRYHDLPGTESPDFTLLFVPIEPAFSCAVRTDPQLFQDAFDQHVVMVSPTTLLATLSTVSSIWRYERQNRNALQIADRAGKLYDKFVGFLGDMDEIGDRLRQAHDAHAAAVNKLKTGRGNLVRQAEQVKALGAKAAKKIDAEWSDDEPLTDDAE